MATATVVPLTKESQKLFISYYSNILKSQKTVRGSRRNRFSHIDRVYQRELDQTEEQKRAKQANNNGDPSRYQNMTVPVVMPQVEAAVTYQSSVFLTGLPIFGVVANPQFMDEAIQMEALLEQASIKGGWVRELILFFRDGFKYNFAPIEVSWNKEVTHTISTDLAKDVNQGVVTQTIWEGNSLKRLDPYNTFVDNRVPPSEVYKDGEYAGYTKLMSRIKLKSLIAELPDKIISNIAPAFSSGTATLSLSADAESEDYYVPTINPDIDPSEFVGTGTNWIAWAGLNDTAGRKGMEYKDSYYVTTLYTRVLPSEFNLKVPASNTPQIYKLIIVNHEHIIYCERQTNAHGYLPILIGQPLEDGLSYQTKSLADNGAPFQNLATAYMTSIIDSRRRAISDRLLYDPSRVLSAHINSANPSAKIPVRPAAFGKNLSESVYAFPYREDQTGVGMQQIQTILGLANQLTGQNQAQQGQFVKGNKTLQEFESVMNNANGRDQLASLLLEYQVFVPLKLILKLDILQYQGGTTIYNRDRRKVVEIDPLALRKAVIEFKVTDGLTPASKVLNSDAFSVAMQVIGSSPQISGNYNLPQLFSYIMKTQGAEITDFEKSPEQVAYEQALSAWQGTMQLAIEKGIDPKTLNLGPQPLPKEFNYNPQNNNPAPEDNQEPAQQEGMING